MSINIGPPATDDLRPKITVIGVGGAGGNAIANMIAAEIEGVDFIVAHTDAQALSNASADKRIQLDPSFKVVDNFRTKECAFWRKFHKVE